MDRLCRVGDLIRCPKLPIIKNTDPLYIADASHPNLAHTWLVTAVELTGGGTGHGPHDVFPDGHRVTVQLMQYDGSYALKEFHSIKFYQTGCFTHMIQPKDIELIEEVEIVSKANQASKKRTVIL